MPNTASAKKRLRQNINRRVRNRAVRSTVRTRIKKVRSAIAAGDVAESEARFREMVKTLDKAASKGIVHANAAARTKSRLSKAIKTLKSAGTAKSEQPVST